ncbi:MAG: glutathione S-transferase N-terminal domain-containing protein [Guyparkeria sp.]|uniref:glutathione S-transferase N-terminal domain-containing protein n=1 Tax=Guyparkeria sp. TaxID=2035736 RepID=UPI0039793AF9
MATVNRRSVMTLFTSPDSPDCHRTRIVLAEKELTAEIIDLSEQEPPEDFHDLSPEGTVPVLADRDLVLTNARVIMEYLDERFPHPPLMPVDPVSRAKVRTALYRIEKDWYGLLPEFERGEKTVARARKQLKEGLLSAAPIFSAMPFFMSEEFSLADVTLAALLWYLPKYGIELSGPGAKPILDYMDRVFSRPTFQASLTEVEREMREGY